MSTTSGAAGERRVSRVFAPFRPVGAAAVARHARSAPDGAGREPGTGLLAPLVGAPLRSGRLPLRAVLLRTRSASPSAPVAPSLLPPLLLDPEGSVDDGEGRAAWALQVDYERADADQGCASLPPSPP